MNKPKSSLDNAGPPGPVPRISIESLPPSREHLLEQLLNAQELSWNDRHPLSVEVCCQHLATATESDCTAEEMLALICNEVYLREMHQQQPQLAEYLHRFPTLAEPLRIQWDVDRLLMSEVPGLELASPTLAAPATGQHPQQIGDFQIVREAGRGGMGIVYEAIELSLQRRVALKILDTKNSTNSVWLRRFQREARAAALLHHTNIVPVFAVGQIDGVHYYVMPFIEGLSLASLLPRLRGKSITEAERCLREVDLNSKPTDGQTTTIVDKCTETPNPGNGTFAPRIESLPSAAPHFRGQASTNMHGDSLRQQSRAADDIRPSNPTYYRSVVQIGLQIAEALEHAFHQGVLHRDIKPGNLMMARDGTIWVTDFGLARINEGDDLTTTGEVMGTLRYLAPERLHGQHTVQGDLYGLGMTLYELLTRRIGFSAADGPGLIRQILEEQPPPPRRFDPEIPRDLDTIVMRAIAKDIKHRYASPTELVVDLRMFLEDRPILSRRTNRAEIAWRWCRRNPGISSLLLSVAALLLVIASGGLMWGRSLQRDRDALSRSEMAAKQSEQQAIIATHTALASADAARQARRSAEQSEAQRKQDLFQVYLSDMERIYDSNLRGHRLDGLRNVESALDVLPLANLAAPQVARLRNAAIGCLSHADVAEFQRIEAEPQLGHTVDIDPQFQVLVHSGENQQTVLHWLDGSQPDQTLTDGLPHHQYLYSRWFSPCGRWLLEAYGQMNGSSGKQVTIWDWRSGGLALKIDLPEDFWKPCFHPNGQQVFHIANSRIIVHDLATGQLLRKSPPRFRASRLSISPDGKYLVSLVPRHHPEIIDAESWEVVSIADEINHSHEATWSPRSSTLLIGMEDFSTNLWDVRSQASTAITRYAAAVASIKYSPRGRLVAIGTADGYSHICEAEGLRELVVVAGQALQFSQDESRLAVRTTDAVILYQIIDSPSFISINQSAQAANFSPDGDWLGMSGGQGVMLVSTVPPGLRCDLGLDETGPVAWHPQGHELVTFGMFSHLVRWPIDRRSLAPDLALGPPRNIALNTALARIGADNRIPQHAGKQAVWDSTGQLLYYADSRHSHIWRYDAARNKNEVVVDLSGANAVAVSPDGKWLAGVSAPIESVVVWNSKTGERMLEVPGAGQVAFGMDNQNLAVSNREEVRFYNTKSWQLTQHFPIDVPNTHRAAPLAFQPQGDLLAVAVSGRCVRLIDPRSLESIADLPCRQEADISWLSFSGDGGLLAITRAERDVMIWNLHSLRQELEGLGLQMPALPTAVTRPPNHATITVDRGRELIPADAWWTSHELLARFEAVKLNYPDAIDRLDVALDSPRPLTASARAKLHMLRGDYHLALKSADLACADFREAVRLEPHAPHNIRRLAELLLVGPPEVRDNSSAAIWFQQLASVDEPQLSDQLHLTLVLLRLERLRAAHETFKQIDAQKIASADALSQFAYHCLRSKFRDDASSSTSNDGATSLVIPMELVERAQQNATAATQALLDEYRRLAQ